MQSSTFCLLICEFVDDVFLLKLCYANKFFPVSNMKKLYTWPSFLWFYLHGSFTIYEVFFLHLEIGLQRKRSLTVISNLPGTFLIFWGRIQALQYLQHMVYNVYWYNAHISPTFRCPKLWNFQNACFLKIHSSRWSRASLASPKGRHYQKFFLDGNAVPEERHLLALHFYSISHSFIRT